MTLLAINKLLDQASREYLLEGKVEFKFPIRFTDQIRLRPQDLEHEIKNSGFLAITDYRDLKEGSVKVGRPSEVVFSFGDLVKKRPEIQRVSKAWNEALDFIGSGSNDSYVKSFIRANYALCVRKATVLPSCVRILEYLRNNRMKVRGMFPRQIPHAESSKLILGEPILLGLYEHLRKFQVGVLDESQKGWNGFFEYFGLRKKPYLFQFFAPEVEIDGLTLANHHGLIGENNSSRIKFSQNPLLIVENEETFYALQESGLNWNLLRGAGKAVALAGFLRVMFGEKVFYWGDIDKEGYEIFASVQNLFPTAQPLLMCLETLSRFKALSQDVPKTKPADRELSYDLQPAYEYVCRNGIRIEQEKMPIEELLDLLKRNGLLRM